jgi:hypothetical protein
MKILKHGGHGDHGDSMLLPRAQRVANRIEYAPRAQEKLGFAVIAVSAVFQKTLIFVSIRVHSW